LTHPALRDALEVHLALDYQGRPADIVLLDRLWGPWMSPWAAERLVERVRGAGVRLLYSLDDNLLDLPAERDDWPTPVQLEIVEMLLREANGILVSTEPLRARLAAYNRNIAVVPNALDERLVVGREPSAQRPGFRGADPLVIGWMGTRTHDRDLQLVAPAIREIGRRHGRKVRFECIGVAGGAEGQAILRDLGMRSIMPPLAELEYPQFMLWFTASTRWDIALAALADTPFTRCKSDLKYLDYAAIGTAGVYSDVVPYTTGVRHEETGLVVSNDTGAWVAAIERLIEDRDLRHSLATAATIELYRERILARRALDWVAALQGLMSNAPVPV
jgi:glycosyltransferase involved in cell wall biosynthesis